MIGNPREFTLDDLLVEALHIVGTEWRDKRTHLVQDTAERPNVTLAIVRLVTPDLRTSVVGCSCLSVTQALFNDLTDVEISQFSLHVFKEEQIGTLHVTMQDLADVERAKSTDDLNENVPDLLLLDVGLPFLVVADLLEDVTIIGILHDEAQARGGLIDEGVFVADDIRVVN